MLQILTLAIDSHSAR